MMLAMLSPVYAERGRHPGGPGAGDQIIRVQTREDIWIGHTEFVVPSSHIGQIEIHSLTNTVETRYLLWRRSDGTHRITPFISKFCYNLSDGGRHPLGFGGIKGTAHYHTTSVSNSSDEVHVLNNGDHNCDHYVFPLYDRHWYKMREAPVVEATGAIVEFGPDTKIRWHDNGNTFRHIKPGQKYDFLIKPYHHIVKKW